MAVNGHIFKFGFRPGKRQSQQGLHLGLTFKTRSPHVVVHIPRANSTTSNNFVVASTGVEQQTPDIACNSQDMTLPGPHQDLDALSFPLTVEWFRIH